MIKPIRYKGKLLHLSQYKFILLLLSFSFLVSILSIINLYDYEE